MNVVPLSLLRPVWYMVDSDLFHMAPSLLTSSSLLIHITPTLLFTSPNLLKFPNLLTFPNHLMFPNLLLLKFPRLLLIHILPSLLSHPLIQHYKNRFCQLQNAHQTPVTPLTLLAREVRLR